MRVAGAWRRLAGPRVRRDVLPNVANRALGKRQVYELALPVFLQWYRAVMIANTELSPATGSGSA